MKRLSNTSTKYYKYAFVFKNLCRKISKVFYALMRSCEHLSGDAKIIEEIQNNLQEEINDAKNKKKKLEFIEQNVITKEEHIERLYMFIGALGVNFRDGKFDEVDSLLRKINL